MKAIVVKAQQLPHCACCFGVVILFLSNQEKLFIEDVNGVEIFTLSEADLLGIRLLAVFIGILPVNSK